MKNYGKLGLVGLFSLVVIGGYYTTNALAETSSPEYIIKTRSGDEAYIENMFLFGNVSNEENAYWDYVQMSTQGTKAMEGFSFNEQLDNVHALSLEIQQLYHNYPSFLRGKSMNSNLYYEDEASLVYADTFIDNYDWPYKQIEVAVLDKASEKEKQFLVDIPEYDRYEGMYIEDIQKNGDEVVLSTTNYFTDPQQAERHVYRVNLETKEMVEDHIVQPAVAETGADYTSILINTLTNPHSMKSERYLVYQSSLKDEQEAATENKVLLAYDTVSGEWDELAVPEELKEIAPHQGIKVHDSSVYFTHTLEDGFEVTHFDIEKNTVVKTAFIALPGEVMQHFRETLESNHYLTHIEGNIIYYISSEKEGLGKNVAIVAGDLETGRVLYDGFVVNGPDMGESFKDNLLYVEGVVFR